VIARARFHEHLQNRSLDRESRGALQEGEELSDKAEALRKLAC
jgi:hypothetical protein